MNKKVIVCPMGIVCLLFGVFLFRKFFMFLPFSYEDSNILGIMTFIGIIGFSFGGVVQNINTLRRKRNVINITLSIVYIAILLVTTFCLLIALEFEPLIQILCRISFFKAIGMCNMF